jgi:arylsulfatase A-like enzyme
VNRRDFLKVSVSLVAAGLAGSAARSAQSARPNIILCMADDLGWGDTGYNGNDIIRTPYLDRMAAEGVRFDRFYSASAVCSPTRGSCLTGRHPYRYGIYGANTGHLKDEEIHLAEVLKPLGYRTGHFGKWHLGTLTTELRDSNRGRPGDKTHYEPPWEQSFDVCFSTEAKVPTWDPMVDPESGEVYGTRYFTGPGEIAEENLEGDDSRIIMDRAIPFIRDAAEKDEPFFAVIWFHAPHKPVVSGPPYTDGYDEDVAEYYGCITALDAQMGRLRAELEALGVADNTMLWYTSDNGSAPGTPGSTGPYRDRKGSLYEGGVRVPGLLVWPDRIEEPRTVDMPCSTHDYFPTILDALDLPMPDDRPYDGISLWPVLDGAMTERPRPIGFQYRDQLALTDNRYKIYSGDDGATFELYDLIADPSETNNIAKEKPDILSAMKATLAEWRASCRASDAGDDYD